MIAVHYLIRQPVNAASNTALPVAAHTCAFHCIFKSFTWGTGVFAGAVGLTCFPVSRAATRLAMFKAICVSSGKSAKATLIQSAVQPVVASDTHKTTARTAFIIEFECITFLRIRFGFEREFESEKQ